MPSRLIAGQVASPGAPGLLGLRMGATTRTSGRTPRARSCERESNRNATTSCWRRASFRGSTRRCTMAVGQQQQGKPGQPAKPSTTGKPTSTTPPKSAPVTSKPAAPAQSPPNPTQKPSWQK